jgi:hypothetical protein
MNASVPSWQEFPVFSTRNTIIWQGLHLFHSSIGGFTWYPLPTETFAIRVAQTVYSQGQCLCLSHLACEKYKRATRMQGLYSRQVMLEKRYYCGIWLAWYLGQAWNYIRPAWRRGEIYSSAWAGCQRMESWLFKEDSGRIACKRDLWDQRRDQTFET